MLVVLGFSVYWFLLRTKESKPAEPKQAPITVKKHTEEFNSSIDQLMASYYGIKDAFVEGDTANAKKNTVSFLGLLNNLFFSL